MLLPPPRPLPHLLFTAWRRTAFSRCGESSPVAPCLAMAPGVQLSWEIQIVCAVLGHGTQARGVKIEPESR